MDEDKARFLFGEVPAGMDVDDPDARALFFEEADPYEERPAWAALQSVIANQIADDTPAEVWQVARDLVGRGIDRAQVLEAGGSQGELGNGVGGGRVLWCRCACCQ